jgi:6,7-dimethyl-8-ribityllumazine synthase
MGVKTKPPRRAAADSSPPDEPSRILIIEGRFYEAISDALLEGAVAALKAAGASYDRITVPGALEIPQALMQAVTAGLIPDGQWDGAVALGCVIRGETTHYDIVCNNANHWLMEVAIRNSVPVGNGILTVENEAQAMARARGGVNGKGADAVRACLKLIDLARAFEGEGV